jgi:hypothetical protein
MNGGVVAVIPIEHPRLSGSPGIAALNAIRGNASTDQNRYHPRAHWNVLSSVRIVNKATAMPATPVKSTRKLKVRFIPTPEQRKMVSTHTAYGIAQAEICAILNITLPTLHKHFRMELDTGLARANVVMAEALFHQGTKLNSTNATIFWLRTRAKWTEARPDARDEEGGERTVNIRITGGLPDD